MKVITLTPNPALDLSGHVCGLTPNEKNYVFDERRDPGGNGINAARVASRLKLRSVQVIATGWLGGPSGDEVRDLLDAEKIKHAFSPISGHTRTNVTVNNESTHQQTRLTFPGPEILPKEETALLASLSRIRGPGLFVIGGSLPPGCSLTFHSKVVALAAKNRFGVIADVPSKNLKGLLTRAQVGDLLFVKPNQTELEEWTGQKLESIPELVQAGVKMARKVTLVCISLADKGALLIHGRNAWMAHAPKIKAKGTVGAGDSMVGAFSAKLVENGITLPHQIDAAFSKAPAGKLPTFLEDALCWGLAAGAATASVSGTSLARPADIRRLRPRVKIQKL